MKKEADKESIGPQLLISQQEFREVLQSCDRRTLRDWLSQQRVESPDISMSVAEYIAKEMNEIDRLELSEQIAKLEELQSKLLGLPMREFGAAEGPGAKYLGRAIQLDNMPDMLFGPYGWYDGLKERLKQAVPSGPPVTDLPLLHRRFKKTDAFHTINPGRIGPNFVHTWALDVTGVKAFRFPMFKSGNNILLRTSTTMGNDRLTIIDSCNRVLQTFNSTYDFHTKTVDLQNRPPCQHDTQTQPYTRIYLVLETSSNPSPGSLRSFKLQKLESLHTLIGSERVYVMADEINYDYFDTSIQPPNVNDFVDARDSHGKPVKLYPPWAGGLQGTNNNLKAAFKVKPSIEKGWYLLGLNTTYADQDFYSVVYYNERKAMLRVYLYNFSQQSEHTAHIVKVYFEGVLKIAKDESSPSEKKIRVSAEYRALKGAFFPIDPNPKKWWRAELVISGWKPQSWTAVDVPVLYPMGSNLPAIGDFKLGSNCKPGHNPISSVGSWDRDCNMPRRIVNRYRSMYEDSFAQYQKNVRLVVSVRSFDVGYGDFKLIADAVGQAVHKNTPAWYETVFDAVKTGKDWFGYVDEFGDICKKDLKNTIKNAKGAAKKTAEEALDKMSNSFSLIGGVVAATGGIIKLFGGLMSTEATILAVTLAIKGKVSGKITFQHIEKENRFYLPGRFSMIDAFSVDAVASDNIRASIDSALPRYDRTLGLFGYAFQPWDVEANIDGFLRLGQPIRDGVPLAYTQDTFMFPSRHEVYVTTGNKARVPYYEYDKRLLPDLLPVITNPRAEIDIIPVKYNQTCEYIASSYRFVDGYPYDIRMRVPCSEIFLVANDRADRKVFHTSMKWSKYTGWPKATSHRRTGSDPYSPPLRINLKNVKLPSLETELLPYEPFEYCDRRGVDVDVFYSVDYGLQGSQKLNWQRPDPMLLTDVMYHWKMSYVYWGDTRVPAGSAVPRVESTMLSTPVMIRLLGSQFRNLGKLPAAFTQKFDSMATLPNGKTYVTKGDQYVRYSDDSAGTVDAGYPKPIKGNWGKLPIAFNKGFDSIATLPNGKIYITKGDQYIRYSDDSANTVDAGYPKPIKGNWGKLPAAFNQGFDSMATLPGDKTYITKGDQYVRYSDENANVVDAGYPKPIKGNWGKLPLAFYQGFDTMATLPDDKIYITRDEQYVCYSHKSTSDIDPGYPKPIGEGKLVESSLLR